jgi:hypothetical protein
VFARLRNINRHAWAVLCLLGLLVACGGVGEDGTGAAEPVVSVGMLKGLGEFTITVNDVTYAKNGAPVTDGFGNRIQFGDLRLGMWIEVTGTVDEASGTGAAASIRVRPAMRGTVSGIDGTALSVTLLQSTARYDMAATVIEGTDRADALLPGDTVEVHGPLGAAAGTVRATRIEKLSSAPTADRPFELRGRVSLLAATTMTVGRQSVDFAGANVTLRQTLADGQVVRVAAAAPPVAGQAWRVERVAPDQPLPANLGFVYAEGITAEWTSGPRFKLEDLLVDATTANNRGAVTGDELRVAVLGSLNQGTLVAKSVTLVKPGQPVVFVLSGPVSEYKSVADFRVRGVLVDASAAAFAGGTAADLADGRKLRVTGTVLGRKIIATKCEFLP